MFRLSFTFGVFLAAAIAGQGGSTLTPPPRLTVALAQTANEVTIAGSRDRILATIRDAAEKKARVVVFPQAALSGRAQTSEAAEVSGSVAAIRRAARKHEVYVLFGAFTRFAPGFGDLPASREKPFSWMFAIDPLGRDIFRHDRSEEDARASLPRLFDIDGIPVHAMIGSRTRSGAVEELPIIEGAKISFELSNDLAAEWVPGLEWYTNVTRARRNSVWVVFANSGNLVRPSTQEVAPVDKPRHGHSAVISPDGDVVASLDRREDLLVTTIDVARATRAGAKARRNHSVYGQWWQRGLEVRDGVTGVEAALNPQASPEKEVTIAAAQIVLTHDRSTILQAIRTAASQGARLVAFPARSLRSDTSATLNPIREAAREAGIYVAIGVDGAAFVFSPEGEQLTRYIPGGDPKKMWFRLDGIPAIVTMGDRDALWSEISELAAASGAQIRIHLAHDTSTGEQADLERRQIGAAMSSCVMLTAVVNAAAPSAAGRSAIWDDLDSIDKAATAIRGGRLTKPESVFIYSPWSANLVTEANGDEQILYVTRRVNKLNPHLSRATPLASKAQAWWNSGVSLIQP
jgi:predicted amidohydrolase